MSAGSLMNIFMEKLVSLQFNLCEQLACDIYGQRLGSHLYEKFERVDCNATAWYNSMDSGNRNKLVSHLENEIDGLNVRKTRHQKTSDA